MANWGILKENENLYIIIINGMRARNIKNGEEHGPIEHIDHGRNSDELWVRNIYQLIFILNSSVDYTVYICTVCTIDQR